MSLSLELINNVYLKNTLIPIWLRETQVSKLTSQETKPGDYADLLASFVRSILRVLNFKKMSLTDPKQLETFENVIKELKKRVQALQESDISPEDLPQMYEVSLMANEFSLEYRFDNVAINHLNEIFETIDYAINGENPISKAIGQKPLDIKRLKELQKLSNSKRASKKISKACELSRYFLARAVERHIIGSLNEPEERKELSGIIAQFENLVKTASPKDKQDKKALNNIQDRLKAFSSLETYETTLPILQ